MPIKGAADEEKEEKVQYLHSSIDLLLRGRTMYKIVNRWTMEGKERSLLDLKLISNIQSLSKEDIKLSYDH